MLYHHRSSSYFDDFMFIYSDSFFKPSLERQKMSVIMTIIYDILLRILIFIVQNPEYKDNKIYRLQMNELILNYCVTKQVRSSMKIDTLVSVLAYLHEYCRQIDQLVVPYTPTMLFFAAQLKA